MSTYNYYYNPSTEETQARANATQYSDKPDAPNATPQVIVKDTIIQQTPRVVHEIDNWRSAHSIADSKYFPNRSWLYNLYDDIWLDGHVTGIVQKRLDSVLNKELYFTNAKGERDENMDKLIRSAEFRMVCKTIGETVLWGISGLEFEPGEKFKPKLVPRKHIKPKWQVISIEEGGNTGLDYTTASNILIVGEPEDLGLFLKVVPYVIYKRNNTGAWAQYIEIFGQPIRVMYYDAFDEQAKLELKQTLDESGGSLALMIPKGVEFDIKDGKVTNGDGKLQDTFKDFLNEEMSVIVLGNTETTTHNGQTGTGGKSKVHSQQQDEVIKSDMAYLLSWLNSEKFLKILASYGYTVEGGTFMFNKDINIEQQAKQIDIDDKLQNKLGLPLDHDELYKYYGRTKPKDYDDRIARAKAENTVEDAEEVGEEEEKQQPPKKKAAAKPATRKLSHSRLRNLLDAAADFFGHARR